MRFNGREFEWTGFDWPGGSAVVDFTDNLKTITNWITKHVKDRMYFDCEFDKLTLGLVQLGVPGQVLIVDVASNYHVMKPIQELFWKTSVHKIGFAIRQDMIKLQNASASYAWTLNKTRKQKLAIQNKWRGQWASAANTIDLQEVLRTRLKGSQQFKLLQKTYLRKDNPCAQQPIRVSECKDPTNPPDPLKTEFKLTEYASLVFPMDLTNKLNQSKHKYQQTKKWTEKDSTFDITEIQYAASDVVILFYLYEFVVALPSLSLSVLHKKEREQI